MHQREKALRNFQTNLLNSITLVLCLLLMGLRSPE
jgi:hypothetical protein